MSTHKSTHAGNVLGIEAVFIDFGGHLFGYW
jgi:hypothetical protein